MLARAKIIKLLLLDLPCAFRDLLKRDLERQGTYEVLDNCPVEDLATFCVRRGIQVLVCNPEMAEDKCAAVIRESRLACPHLRILIVARDEKVGHVGIVHAIQGGADGCVLRSEPLEQLLLALEVVVRGGRCFSAKTQAILNDPSLAAISTLTSRQCEVLRLIAEGLSTKEISARLQVSVKTADHHRARVMKRLDLHDVVAAVRFAIRAGLVTA